MEPARVQMDEGGGEARTPIILKSRSAIRILSQMPSSSSEYSWWISRF